MAKKPHHENTERYLITYSDLITLLLAFFIILYAMSKINIAAYDSLSHSLSLIFNNNPQNSLTTMQLSTGSQQSSQTNQPLTANQFSQMQAVSENNQLSQIQQQVNQAIQSNSTLRASGVNASLTTNGLAINLPDQVLFALGSAQIQPQADPILNAVSALLQKMPNPVQVNGYTDDTPIDTPQFPSNWELSSTRADAVVQYLLNANTSLNPARFSATGFSQYRPVSNTNNALNRRVVILIQRMSSTANLLQNGSTGTTNPLFSTNVSS